MSIDLINETIVSVPEAAKHFDISPSVAWRMVLSGKVPSVKIGGSRKVTLESFARVWLAESSTEEHATDADQECAAEGI